MTYYCFLCNKDHEDSQTKEHFIPRSIKGPENQWLPVCTTSNTRANSVFDSGARDILYLARHQQTGILKRMGDALLSDGTLKQYKFSYDEPKALKDCGAAFQYFFDRKSNKKMRSSDIYAIKFSIGLTREEQQSFYRGLAKISIGSLAYLLMEEGIKDEIIKQIFSQTSIDSIRHFALDLPWSGIPIYHKFSIGRTDVLSRLQSSCKNPLVSNHTIQITFQENNSILIQGMLYSKFGWELILSNNISLDIGELRLENTISDLSVPEDLRDISLSPDSICLINPNYNGKEPAIPQSWRNISGR